MINDIEATLGCCGSLITVDEEELTVRFAHHSVKQFVVGKMESVYYSGPLEYQCDPEDAERQMGYIIVTYLSYGVFVTQLWRVVVPKIPAKDAPSKIIISVLDQSKSRISVKSLAIGLLRSRKESSFDIGKVLADARDSVQPSSTGDFQFLAYAKAYWLQHTMWFGIGNFLGELKAIYPLWQKVVVKYIKEVPNELSKEFFKKLDNEILETTGYTALRAYMARSRLRMGIRIVMLANCIEAGLKPA